MKKSDIAQLYLEVYIFFVFQLGSQTWKKNNKGVTVAVVTKTNETIATAVWFVRVKYPKRREWVDVSERLFTVRDIQTKSEGGKDRSKKCPKLGKLMNTPETRSGEMQRNTN